MSVLPRIKAPLLRVKSLWPRDPHHFLRDVRGVIHVGANSGQERDIYYAHGTCVTWIEPIPEVFARLQANIARLPRQRAIQGLVSDTVGTRYRFHISNNDGQSSSFLPFRHHSDIWPDVHFERTIELASETLPSLLKRHSIDHRDHQALVLDTQGSELLVLRGAVELLPSFSYVKVEASDFEVYEGGCTLADLGAFLSRQGFRELSRRCFARRRQGGQCFDVTFERVAG
jgi:FkbM family methyltransferase